MKHIITSSLILILFSGCYKAMDEKGFLSEDVYLKGADTTKVAIGGKGNTDVAWMDGSSLPAQFSIENIRDASGNRSEQFFQKYKYSTWIKPYNNKTDTTMALIKAKISERELPALGINPVNGMLQWLETTSNLKNPGDVFKVDVRVKNSKGEQVLKDYATLKLTSDKKPFTVYRVTTAILLVNGGGSTTFTLYDDILEDQFSRHQNIYDRNGKEFVDIYKLSDEPSTGVKVLIQYQDS